VVVFSLFLSCLQNTSSSGGITKALPVLEGCWERLDGDIANRADVATCMPAENAICRISDVIERREIKTSDLRPEQC